MKKSESISIHRRHLGSALPARLRTHSVNPIVISDALSHLLGLRRTTPGGGLGTQLRAMILYEFYASNLRRY